MLARENERTIQTTIPDVIQRRENLKTKYVHDAVNFSEKKKKWERD